MQELQSVGSDDEQRRNQRFPLTAAAAPARLVPPGLSQQFVKEPGRHDREEEE